MTFCQHTHLPTSYPGKHTQLISLYSTPSLPYRTVAHRFNYNFTDATLLINPEAKTFTAAAAHASPRTKRASLRVLHAEVSARPSKFSASSHYQFQSRCILLKDNLYVPSIFFLEQSFLSQQQVHFYLLLTAFSYLYLSIRASLSKTVESRTI